MIKTFKLELEPVRVEPHKGKYYRPSQSIDYDFTTMSVFHHLAEVLIDRNKPYGIPARDMDTFKVIAGIHNVEIIIKE